MLAKHFFSLCLSFSRIPASWTRCWPSLLENNGWHSAALSVAMCFCSYFSATYRKYSFSCSCVLGLSSTTSEYEMRETESRSRLLSTPKKFWGRDGLRFIFISIIIIPPPPTETRSSWIPAHHHLRASAAAVQQRRSVFSRGGRDAIGIKKENYEKRRRHKPEMTRRIEQQ